VENIKNRNQIYVITCIKPREGKKWKYACKNLHESKLKSPSIKYAKTAVSSFGKNNSKN
jgi:hypothetical protein